MKKGFRALGAALILAACGLATAETIQFISLNAKQGFPAILQGRAEYTDKIKGEFHRPDNAKGDVPAMVIMHGSGGIGEVSTEAWSRFFLNMGIATFVVDSFGPRGIQSSANDQSVLSYPASAVDALTALRTVAKIPGIDPTKIGVIGFSRGAFATTAASYENIRAAVLGPNDSTKFALHIAYYGGCGAQVGTTTGKPILFLLGGKDDFVSLNGCPDTAQIMRDRGANVEVVVYPDAKHCFDQDRKDVYMAQAQSFRNVPSRYQDLDDLTYYVEGRKVSSKEFGETYGKNLTRGASTGYDGKAATDAKSRVTILVHKNFAM